MTNQLSNTTSNAVIYTTYVAFFVFGLFASWKWARSKADFIASLRTQSSMFTYSAARSLLLLHRPVMANCFTAIPVALNFTAACKRSK